MIRPLDATRTGAAAVALVWWYEGLWDKVLGGSPDQRAIVAAVPWLPARAVTAAVLGIGLAEVALGAWALSGWRPRPAAVVQTGALVAFNAGGLAFGAAHVPDPAGMLVRNVAFLALVWLVALRTKGSAG